MLFRKIQPGLAQVLLGWPAPEEGLDGKELLPWGCSPVSPDLAAQICAVEIVWMSCSSRVAGSSLLLISSLVSQSCYKMQHTAFPIEIFGSGSSRGSSHTPVISQEHVPTGFGAAFALGAQVMAVSCAQDVHRAI